MSFNTRKISGNSLQSSQPQSQNLKSSQLKASQQSSTSNNPFKLAVSRNPFLKPQKNSSSQATTGNDNDDYEGEGDEDTNLSNTKKNSKLREIISIDRFNGKVIRKWVPIEEDTREFRRSTLNEVENNRKSVFSRHKSTLGADNYIESQSPKNTQQSSQGRKGDLLSQNTNKPTKNNNFISPEKFNNNNDFKSTQDNQQNVNNSLLRQSVNVRAEQNEFQSPNQKYTINHSPLRYELGSDNNRYNTTKFNNFDSPTKRIKRPQDSAQFSAKRNAGFDTQSPLEFPNPDPSLSPIKDYLIEWAQAENLTQPTHDFLKLQPNLTSWQRASLINWIPKLYSKVNFGKGQNYYLIVRLIDRALGIKQFPKGELKSLILTSIWFITRYYDSSPITLSQFIDVLNLPEEYLGKIQTLNNWLFQNFYDTMLNCNPHLFLRKLSQELNIQDLYIINVSKYLIDYSSLDYKLSQLRPSLISTSALLITKHLLSTLSAQEAEKIAKLAGYKLRHLVQVGVFLIDYCMTHPNFGYINEKFNLDNGGSFSNFSKFVRVEFINLRGRLQDLVESGYNLEGITSGN